LASPLVNDPSPLTPNFAPIIPPIAIYKLLINGYNI
jgi:hypothetical protein